MINVLVVVPCVGGAPASPEACHTATPDDSRCFLATTWAHIVGLNTHPERYRGLNRTSRFEEIQRIMHRDSGEFEKYGCTEPW